MCHWKCESICLCGSACMNHWHTQTHSYTQCGCMCDCVNVWLRVRMCFYEWSCVHLSMTECECACMKGYVNEWFSVWIFECESVWMIEHVNVSERVNVWMIVLCECACVNVWVSERVNVWVSEHVNVGMIVCVNVLVWVIERRKKEAVAEGAGGTLWGTDWGFSGLIVWAWLLSVRVMVMGEEYKSSSCLLTGLWEGGEVVSKKETLSSW